MPALIAKFLNKRKSNSVKAVDKNSSIITKLGGSKVDSSDSSSSLNS